MIDLEILANAIEATIPASVKSGAGGGLVLSIWHDGQQLDRAWGTANLNTGQAMTPDTGWLLGSVTKVLTTSLLMRYVDRGVLSLDDKVTTHLPDFKVGPDGAESAMTLRSLVNHTNGMDADTYMPTREIGHGAVKAYVDGLADLGVLFDVGETIHYSNPGFVVAGRLLEVLTGTPFNILIEQELFAPTGMQDACASAEQAMLRRTAIGANPISAEEATPTHMFMLPVSGGPAGATPIVTTADMIAFARMHLSGGVAVDGSRVLSQESVTAMQTPTFRGREALGIPSDIGLGWFMPDIFDRPMLTHQGGSPGGRSALTVFPDDNLVVVAFGTGVGQAVSGVAGGAVAKGLLGVEPEFGLPTARAEDDLSRYEGSYRHFQYRTEVVADGDVLEFRNHFEPYDLDHAEFLGGYSGVDLTGDLPPEVFRLAPVGNGLFINEQAIDGPPMAALESLTSFSGERDGRTAYFYRTGRTQARVA